jgi:DNA polymerase I-like protein with 3'-5' exonuclease and polymerase domains
MNSPKQLGEILFEKMQLDPKQKRQKPDNMQLQKMFFKNWSQNMRSSNIFWNTEPIRN